MASNMGGLGATTNDGAQVQVQAEVRVQLQAVLVIKDGDIAFRMRREAGAAARVDPDTFGVPIAVHVHLLEIEISPCSEINSLGHPAKADQDQYLEIGTDATPLKLLTRHIPTPARLPPRENL